MKLVFVMFLLSLVMILVDSRIFYDFELERMANPEQIQKALHPTKRNPQCLLNAGLSQGCDLYDVINSRSINNRLSSFAGPGRR
ncbi:unnamed protein product [Caenorhabditis angaria]|uniref:Uncharacterized protein n=1 Tax=Caenorhabditis angaria TaxID=860376 RepID=A0A9P1IX04_9PELO|nr:unnamed protein product [Caenorhabditis angaria]